MGSRISLSIGTTAGGLMMAALLSAGAALANTGDASGTAASVFPEVPGSDAFTIGGYIFDPFTTNGNGAEVEGFEPVTQLFSFPPFAEIGGGSVSLLGSGIPLATQAFDVYSAAADSKLLGIVASNEDVANILGMTNTELVVSNVAAAGGVTDGALPTVGTVYDVFNLGKGFENVYVAVPASNGDTGSVQDVLMTPFGQINLSSLFGDFNATQPIDPGAAFTGLTDAAGASASSLGDLFSL